VVGQRVTGQVLTTGFDKGQWVTGPGGYDEGQWVTGSRFLTRPGGDRLKYCQRSMGDRDSFCKGEWVTVSVCDKGIQR
jgi:hypothetical protein